ncbi:MAG: hypothetical protein ACR2N3_09795 [Pyrinomonadaceae bacterium]
MKWKVSIIPIVVGFSVSLISLIFAFGILTSRESTSSKIILWNYYAAVYLADKGWLPLCSDCELLALGYVLFDGFILGFAVYSLACFLPLVLIERLKKNF